MFEIPLVTDLPETDRRGVPDQHATRRGRKRDHATRSSRDAAVGCWHHGVAHLLSAMGPAAALSLMARTVIDLIDTEPGPQAPKPLSMADPTAAPATR